MIISKSHIRQLRLGEIKLKVAQPGNDRAGIWTQDVHFGGPQTKMPPTFTSLSIISG